MGKGVEKKLDQLEKDCSIAMMLALSGNVSDSVGLAVLACPVDKSAYIFENIRSNGLNYSLLKQIAESGRFMYICCTETNNVRIAHIEATLDKIDRDQQKVQSNQNTFFYFQGLTLLTVLAGFVLFNCNK